VQQLRLQNLQTQHMCADCGDKKKRSSVQYSDKRITPSRLGARPQKLWHSKETQNITFFGVYHNTNVQNFRIVWSPANFVDCLRGDKINEIIEPGIKKYSIVQLMFTCVDFPGADVLQGSSIAAWQE
jgi:hypothetical protein